MGLKLVGTPRELLASLHELGFSPEHVFKHGDTGIRSTEVFKTAPDLEILGGPHAETIVDLIEALDERDFARAARVIRHDPVALSPQHDNSAVPLLSSLYSGDLAAVRFLLEHRARADQESQLGMTPLHWAAALGEDDIARELLKAGANAKRLSWFLVTPEELALLNHRRDTQLVIMELTGKHTRKLTAKDIIARMKSGRGWA